MKHTTHRFYTHTSSHRIDKLILDATDNSGDAYTNGDFQIIKGVSSEDPVVPADIETAMTIATIEYLHIFMILKDAVTLQSLIIVVIR